MNQMQAGAMILGQAQRGMGSVFFWLLVLIGLVVGASVVVMYLRKWYAAPDSASPVGFTLGDIRELHRKGQMTDEEFERARAQILGQVQRQMHEGAPPATKSQNADGTRDVKLGE